MRTTRAVLELHSGLGIPAAVAVGFHHRIAHAALFAATSLSLSMVVGLYSQVRAPRRRRTANGRHATIPADRTAAKRWRARPPDRRRFDDGVELQERERRRLAHELHDETLQGLGGLRMLLAAARRQADHEQLVRAIDTAQEMVTDEIQRLRHLIVDLRPPELDEIGLEAAIDKLAARVTALGGPGVTTDVQLQYELGTSVTRLTPDIETAVYRIVQEALTNTVKHAAASSVHVRVADSDGQVEARISDDGRGFSGTTRDDHFGIAGMRERATLIEGRLSIDGSATGTTVRLIAPAIRS